MSDPDAVTRLRLVASSIAGRLLDVRLADSGDRSWTDGRVIYVESDATRREQLQMIAVQAVLLAAGSLEADIVRRLNGRPTLARRYLAIEAPRALAAHEHRLPPAAATLLGHRIGGHGDSPADSLARAGASRGTVEPMRIFGVIRPKALLASDVEPLPAAVPVETRGRRNASVADVVEDSDGASDRSLDVFAGAAGSGGALGRLLQRMLRGQRSSSSGPLGADVPPRGRRLTGAPGAGPRRTLGSGAPADGPVDTDPHEGWVYPEWDVRRRAYRSDWCTVREEDAAANAERPRYVSPPSLRRPLARLGLGLEHVHRRTQGEDVDIDAVVEMCIDRAAGVEPTEAVYVESLRRRHDLAVLVLLDISGSANEPSAAGGRVHDHQVAGTTALLEAVHDLGNRVAAYGFYSRGRSAVRVVRIKRFDEGLQAPVHRRLSAVEPGGYTRLGAAIRHGVTVLEDRGGGSRRLLVVLSDGFAYDHGYDGAYGEADARKALSEARMRGVGCLCVSIGAATDPAALRRVFGSAAHAAVRDPDELARVVGPLFRDALRAVEYRRSA